MKKYFKFLEIESCISNSFRNIRDDLYNISLDLLIHINNCNLTSLKNYIILPESKGAIVNNFKQKKVKLLLNFKNNECDSPSLNVLDRSSNINNNITFKDKYNEMLHNNFFFFQSLLNIIYFEEDFGIKYELGELIKNVIDDSYIEEKGSKYFNLFYEHFLSQLISYVCINYYNDDSKVDSNLIISFNSKINESKQIILDIMTFSIINNYEQSSIIFIDSDAIYEISNIIGTQHKQIDFFIIKFIKSLIFNSNESIFSLLTYKINIFEILLNEFKKILENSNPNCNKQNKEETKINIKINILGSCILECFSCINKCKLRNEFLEHIISNCYKLIKELEPYTSFILKMYNDQPLNIQSKTDCDISNKYPINIDYDEDTEQDAEYNDFDNNLELNEDLNSKYSNYDKFINNYNYSDNSEEFIENNYFKDDNNIAVDNTDNSYNNNNNLKNNYNLQKKDLNLQNKISYNTKSKNPSLNSLLHNKRTNSFNKSKGITIIQSYDDMDDEEKELTELIQENISRRNI